MAACLPPDIERVVTFWAEYCGATGLAASPPPPAEAFGDSRELADELCALVLHGPKRASAGLLADYEHEGAALPRVGGHTIVLDGSGRPRCVVRYTEVRLGPVSSVDDAFAWDEGEGARTRVSWLAEHRAFFGRRCQALGLVYVDACTAVFERFERVWPPPA